MPYKNRQKKVEAAKRSYDRRKQLHDILLSHYAEYPLPRWAEESTEGQKLLLGIFKIGQSRRPTIIPLPSGLDNFLALLNSSNFPLEVKFLGFFSLENLGKEEPKDLILNLKKAS